MNESEEYVELNRLISGELSSAESLKVMRQMLKDAQLRAAYEELQKVDEPLRESYFDDVPDREGIASADGAPQRRREQIARIVQRTSGRAKRGGVARVGSRLRSAFWRRVLPPAAAAAAFVAIALWVAVCLPDRGPAPIGQERIDQLIRVKQDQGGAVAVIRSATGSAREPYWEPVEAKGAKDVIVCVTVMRSGDGEPKTWAMDALVPQGRVMELVKGTGPEWRPESVRIIVGTGEGKELPVTIQARLTPEAEVSQTVRLSGSQPERVAEVRAGPARFEIYIQAELASTAGQIM